MCFKNDFEIFLETSVKKLNSILNYPTHPLYQTWVRSRLRLWLHEALILAPRASLALASSYFLSVALALTWLRLILRGALAS